MTGYWQRRLARHAALAILSGAVIAAVYAAVPAAFVLRKWNLATAYAGLLLGAATLLVGPWNVLRARPNPVSQDLRRDLGIWAALVGLAHTAVGLQVHMQGRWLQYFLWPPNRPHRLPIRTDAFGVANFTGLGATVVLLLLLALSNDLALRRLGTRRWKALQRGNYAGFVLVAVHAAVYQATQNRVLPAVVVFAAVVIVVGLTQLAGYRRLHAEDAGGGGES